MLGKKLYKTGMLNILRLVILAIVIFFMNDFILETYTYEKFEHLGRFKILDVIKYHYLYPHEFITLTFLVILPAFYYALIRGISFHERGFVFNRGIPYMNKVVPYSEVKTYKLLHPKHVLTVQTHDNEIFIITDNTVERVIAILDQHNIQGDLACDDYAKFITNIRKFIVVVLTFTMVLFFLKKMLAG